ncbi:hypothetical protein CKM354_001066300 [Cercospora kikuchii]|uniref:SnoaL-like domain-containing protein n=1 Tax=Cercospora kikuchii TaxID=84275 RepID=A0A9P3CXA9_9PEZI|nr:uncharacterized protein CKM354_001066300 [Cercospora kikuchii]GIZ47575.1 hypothetical protein CKM354_001066300 [Cercospora kikuchii]
MRNIFSALGAIALAATSASALQLASAPGYNDAPLPAAPYCPPQDVSPATQKAILQRFLNKFFFEGNATGALLDHVSEGYIQHNPFINSTRQVAIDFFTAIGDVTAGSNVTILNMGLDNNTGFAHTKWDTPGQEPNIIVDIWRFNGSCIEEHWDVMQRRPENATNPLAMF